MDSKTVESLRKSSGTAPSERPERKTDFFNVVDSIEVTLEDYNANPYKTMFVTSTATWGDNAYKQKWPTTSPEGKFEVIKAVLTNNTLPQAREMVNFVFRVRGVPRWLFDLHTHTPFASFMSIGCRDNNKIDCDIIFEQTKDEVVQSEAEVFFGLKDLYENVLKKGKGSWQSARTFLPQGYQHSYHFGQNLLSIANMKFAEGVRGEAMRELYYRIIDAIADRFPLIAIHADTALGNKEQLFEGIRNMEYGNLASSDKELFESND